MNIAKTACVTGHRPTKLGGYNEDNIITLDVKFCLNKALQILIANDYDTFISGMAIGVDMIFAEMVLDMKHEFPHIKLVCAIPFQGQEKLWNHATQKRYHNILTLSDKNHIVSIGGYDVAKMQTRNQWMVNHSSAIIAVWNGSAGGTANCVNYARVVKHRPRIIRITPRKD